MKTNNIFLFVVTTIFLLLFNSCSSVKRADCIGEGSEGVYISWGDYDYKNKNVINAYRIDTEMNIHNLYSLINDSISKNAISRVNDSLYCKMYNNLINAIVGTQKLNVTSDTVRFIKFEDKKNMVLINGFWNNRLKAIGSESYREVFNLLNDFSPKKFEE